MTEPMEDLAAALTINQVPGRNPMDKCSWEKLAWWSKKSLMQWFDDLLKRHKQLTEWTMEMSTPLCIWISGLFNPTAFNTAIMQVTARRDGLPLDNMAISTAVTAMSKEEEITEQPHNGGRYVHGKYCSLDFFSLSLFQTYCIVIVTYLLLFLKHPNKSFFNPINIYF